MEDEPISHANLIVEEYIKRRLTETQKAVQEYMAGMRKPEDLEDLKEAIREANSYISLTAGEDEELFEAYRYHLFNGASGVYMAQGQEVKGLKGRK
jgi:hypothetical protein